MKDPAELEAAGRAQVEAHKAFWVVQSRLGALNAKGKRGSEEWHGMKAEWDEARAAVEAADDTMHRLMRNAVAFVEEHVPHEYREPSDR